MLFIGTGGASALYLHKQPHWADIIIQVTVLVCFLWRKYLFALPILKVSQQNSATQTKQKLIVVYPYIEAGKNFHKISCPKTIAFTVYIYRGHSKEGADFHRKLTLHRAVAKLVRRSSLPTA